MHMKYRPAAAHRPPLAWAAALALGLGACKGKEDSGDGGGDGAVLPGGGEAGDGAELCGGTPPVIEELRCETSGLRDDETGAPTPTLTLWALTSDADQDLSAYTLNIFFDDVVDGSVSEADPVFGPVFGTVSNSTCTTGEAQLGAILLIKGGNPVLNQQYEFGVTVEDAGGVSSAMSVIPCITPKPDGSEGDGEGI